MCFEILRIPKLFPFHINMCVAVYTESAAHAKIQPDPVKSALSFSRFDFCLLALQASETPLAKFPELPSAQFSFSSPPDQLPICASDEPASEALPASAHCTVGEAHSYKQTWLQLVSW